MSWVDEPVTCGDPECPKPQPSAQPEMDGDFLFYACPCGYEMPAGKVGQDNGVCAAGFSEQDRRAASPVPVPAQTVGEPVFLGTTIGRRPS